MHYIEGTSRFQSLLQWLVNYLHKVEGLQQERLGEIRSSKTNSLVVRELPGNMGSRPCSRGRTQTWVFASQVSVLTTGIVGLQGGYLILFGFVYLAFHFFFQMPENTAFCSTQNKKNSNFSICHKFLPKILSVWPKPKFMYVCMYWEMQANWKICCYQRSSSMELKQEWICPHGLINVKRKKKRLSFF